MVTIGASGDLYCLFDKDGEFIDLYRDHESLIMDILENFIDCSRNYDLTDEQKKKGYDNLRIYEQKEIEREFLDQEREETGFNEGEIYFDGTGDEY